MYCIPYGSAIQKNRFIVTKHGPMFHNAHSISSSQPCKTRQCNMKTNTLTMEEINSLIFSPHSAAGTTVDSIIYAEFNFRLFQIHGYIVEELFCAGSISCATIAMI